MANRIVFLGTAGDSYLMGSQALRTGGIVLDLEDDQFHIDPGPGSLIRLRDLNLNPRGHTAVLVSNNSLLKCDDLNAVIDAMSYGGEDPHGVVLCAESITSFTEESRPRLMKEQEGQVEKVVEVTPDSKVGINYLDFGFPKTRGVDETGVGFKIMTGSVVISYTGDTSYFSGLPAQHKDSDILIVNCKHPASISEKGFMNLEDASKLVGEVQPKLAVITGFGTKLYQKDVIQEAREIQKRTGVETTAGQEGLEVELASYESRTKQTKLK